MLLTMVGEYGPGFIKTSVDKRHKKFQFIGCVSEIYRFSEPVVRKSHFQKGLGSYTYKIDEAFNR